MIVFHRATNIIERDSLIVFLKENGIEAITGRRDVIQNLTDNPNLSYEGYSVLFAGYEIFIEEKDLDQAKTLLKSYQSQVQSQDVDEDASPYSQQKHYERRMMVATILTIIIPIAAHLLLIYLYFSAKRKGLSFSNTFSLRVGIIILASAALGLTFLMHLMS